MSKGVVLLSGGMDSAVTAYVAKKECEQLYAITFRYGQAHSKEVSCALTLGTMLGVEKHKVLDLPLNDIGGSSLFDKGEIPTEGLGKGIPSTWVPQRNAIFLAVTFGWAEVVGADTVYIGVNHIDYSGYPDCRPLFIKAINNALNFASKRWVETGDGISIEAPLMDLSKRQIVELGLKLGVPFQNTTSCYKGGEIACGECASCRIRLKAFSEAGIDDLIKYERKVIHGPTRI